MNRAYILLTAEEAMRHGGLGAPLVAVGHRALFRRDGRPVDGYLVAAIAEGEIWAATPVPEEDAVRLVEAVRACAGR
jgi:1,6-anhydro-N-acetylmuramate kinase